jgi:hypothetical protein
MGKTDKSVSRKSRRKRERDRYKKSTSSEDDRPRTATLKRPFILDESLKDKVTPISGFAEIKFLHTLKTML